MPLSLKDIGFGFVMPMLIAALLQAGLRRFSTGDLGTRYSASIAAAGGFLSGYVSLSLAPLWPTAHWHWVPFAMTLAAVTGPISLARGVTRFERILLALILASIAAWFLVPTWPDLQPDRGRYLCVFAASVVLLIALLEPLAKRFPGPLLPSLLGLSLAAAAGVLLLAGSLRFAQIAGMAVAAFWGCAVAIRLVSRASTFDGAAAFYSVTVTGLLLVGKVNSYAEVPVICYVLLPLAPLMLWTSVRGPLARLQGLSRLACQVAIVVTPLAGAVIVAIIAGG